MKSLGKKSKLMLGFLVCFVCFYIISYPCLRLSRILIARDYTVYITPEEGGQLFENHFDIDHGSAFIEGKLQPGSFLGTIYKPLSFLEMQLRGYGDYPTVVRAYECPD